MYFLGCLIEIQNFKRIFLDFIKYMNYLIVITFIVDYKTPNGFGIQFEWGSNTLIGKFVDLFNLTLFFKFSKS